MAQKRDELSNGEGVAGGIWSALGLTAIAIVGAVINGVNNERVAQGERDEIKAKIERLKIQRNRYENKPWGKFKYKAEIEGIDREIEQLVQQLSKL